MAESYDQSNLDRKYFIDINKYNCPFCNRKSITYSVIDTIKFDWSNEKMVFGYLVRCGGDSCQQTSFHLSNYDIEIYQYKFYAISVEKERVYCSKVDLDELFFYHQPTTFFTLDNRINEKIRTLISESEGCARMNYLVGASGCLRKGIYELLEFEKVPRVDKNERLIDYGGRVKMLKVKYPTVPGEYFDALANIQGMTSEQLHEGDWKAWTQNEFSFLVETVKEILTEVYVRPREKASVLKKILSLKPEKNEKKESGE